MTQPVTHASDIAPVWAFAARLRVTPEANGGFANDLKLALHGGDRFRIFTELIEIHPGGKRFIMPMASTMSRSELFASLKGKHGLASGPFTHAVFQRLCGGQVHPNSENIGKPVLQSHHIQQ